MGDGEEMFYISWDVLWVLWSTTHTSGDGGMGSNCSCKGLIPATPLRSQIIATLLKSHSVSLVGGLLHSCVYSTVQLAWVDH